MNCGRRLIPMVAFAAALLLAGFSISWAQAPAGSTPPATLQAVEVSDAGGQILSFRHLSGTTVVDMKGTRREPAATTRLKVESRPGFLEIDINRGDIKALEPATKFGRDFLTYVLWAVSVDGAAMNLGEITFDRSGPVSINVTTPYQTFWLMVTAEPDFAVKDPSPVVVLYSVNQDAIDTANKALPVVGKLIYYTYYTRYATTPVTVDTTVPNELLQARKAVELASASGILALPTPSGEEPLPDEERTRLTLAQARDYLKQAEEAFRIGGPTHETIQFARTAAQIAENARALALGAVGGIFVRQLERELQRLRAEADQLRARLEDLRRSGAEANAKLAECERELTSLRDRLQQLENALDMERRRSRDLEAQLAAARRECEEQLRALRERIAALEQQLADARAQNARLAEDRDTICAELRRQLASLGQLTQQGGNMVLTLASDILFDLNSYELRPVARENLARLGILRLLLFPQADVRYQGHTDRTGEDDYNQWLSEQRALSVYRYFLEEALARESDPARHDAVEQRLATVQQLLAASYAAARRNLPPRQELLAQLGDTVSGKGEREPVEDVPGASERNRRVVLLFPPAQLGQVSALCEAPAPTPPR